MVLLTLGKGVLPVVVEELSKATLTVNTKVDHNGAGIMVSAVTEPPEHLDHGFPIRGLYLVKFASPRILGVLWLRVRLSGIHAGVISVFILVIIISIPVVIGVTSTAAGCSGATTIELIGGRCSG